ncbi:MAG TPA: hypothetical protein VFP46_01190 [Candidatus Paceibacterota bacterium]|nr:hypothetical protein [Candidatus Paceibacterota bacterium]
MTIAEARQKCKALAAKIPRDALLLSVFVLSCVLSFTLGYLAGNEAGKASPSSVTVSPASENGAPGQVVASKNGTKYYRPDCPSAARLSVASKIWFVSSAAAEAAGYSAAQNCSTQ